MEAATGVALSEPTRAARSVCNMDLVEFSDGLHELNVVSSSAHRIFGSVNMGGGPLDAAAVFGSST